MLGKQDKQEKREKKKERWPRAIINCLLPPQIAYPDPKQDQVLNKDEAHHKKIYIYLSRLSKETTDWVIIL